MSAGDILANYIYDLQNQEKKIGTDFQKLIKSRKGFLILAPLKRRLFNFGIDGNENKIGSYKESTIRKKKKKGLRSSFVTLRNSGGWYQSMEATSERFGDIEITANKTVKDGLLTEILEEKYGNAILDLTPSEQENIAKIVEQEILVNFENIKIPKIEFR